MSEQTRATSIEVEERINTVKQQKEQEAKAMEERLKAWALEKDYWMFQASAISTFVQAAARQQTSASSHQAPPQDWYDNENEKANLMSAVAIEQANVDKLKKEKALAEFKKLKEKNLTESEKQYINSIEPIIRNYKGGGYNGIFRNK